MSIATLNWGLLGTARINRAVIPPLRASSRNRLVAVASRTLERAQAYAAEWHIERAFGSYEAMLADPAIDVVYIALPNAMHAEWTIRAVQAGKHVLCEKPLAVSVAEVDAVAAAAATHGRVVAEAFMYRHHPQTAHVRRLIADGVVGDVRLYRGVFRFCLSRPDDARWEPALGGGCLWDVGCYPVSMARYMAGTEPRMVSGWQRLAPGGVDETFAGQLWFANETCAVFDSSFRAPFATEFEVVGTTGTVRVRTPYKPGLEPVIEIADHEGQVRTVVVDGQELYTGEVENLAAVVLDGAEPGMSLADSRGNVATLAALLESARTGTPIALP